MRVLDRENIQSLVFQPHRCGYSRHFLFRCGDKAKAKRFLAEWTPRVTHGGVDLSDPPGPLVNIAVSWPGLDKVGAFDAIGGVGKAEEAFYFDFKEPPDAASLGAYGPSAPENWWNKKFKSHDIDLTVHVYCTSAQMLAQASAQVRDSARRYLAEELIPTRDGEAITGQALEPGLPGLRKLHFGYSDGFSQPLVNWDDDPALGQPGGPPVYPRGHFILDDWDEKAQSFPKCDRWRSLVHHGSYLALAWIYQDVAGFNRFLRENAPKVAPNLPQKDAEELLAAKMMGRWRDGTPLVLSPKKQAPALAEKDFDYSQDAAGSRCPIGAHIRIVNGRDQPLDAAHSTMFPAGIPRVLRRGSSYGPWLEGEMDDERDRGILGMFLCANVNRQFYALTRWIAATNFSDAFTDPNGQDPLFASRSVPRASKNFTIPGENGAIILKGIPDFIRVQGVAILLLPSLPTLRRLST
jgi:deferrochelatase/peroxidase EfeB